MMSLGAAILFLVSVSVFLTALLACALRSSLLNETRRRILGFIVACELVYFTALFVALLWYSDPESFILAGAIGTSGMILVARRITPSLVSPFHLWEWILASACYVSLTLCAVSVDSHRGISSLLIILLWPLGIACTLAMTQKPRPRRRA